MLTALAIVIGCLIAGVFILLRKRQSPIYKAKVRPSLLAFHLLIGGQIWLDPVFRQDVQLVRLIQPLTQLRLAKTDPPLLAVHSMHCLKNISRQVAFTNQFLKLRKFTFQTIDLGSAF